jgi:hypothetical protein
MILVLNSGCIVDHAAAVERIPGELPVNRTAPGATRPATVHGDDRLTSPVAVDEDVVAALGLISRLG